MLITGCGEFAIGNKNTENFVVFYKNRNGYFKDLFINNRPTQKHSIEISREEYFKKLKQFITIFEQEKGDIKCQQN